MRIAITGATGLVGQASLDAALAAGHDITALARRAQPARTGVTWAEGTLDNASALDALVGGADAVLHIAGAVNVPTRDAFAAANIAGTRAIVDAATRAGVKRFVHVSSLTARLPALSNYGWSKAEGESVVSNSGLDWVIVRPPGVYGPRDTDMLELFRMARRGFMLLPPPGHGSWIHVEDLAHLLLRLASVPSRQSLYEPDGTPGGVAHRALARAIAKAVGHAPPLTLSAPRPLLHLAARTDRLVRGNQAKLTPDRAAYMSHPDWVSMPQLQVEQELWTPKWSLAAGLEMTARWYRNNGWLRP